MPPTYGMYKVSADINQVAVLEVPLTPDFELDTPTILKVLKENTTLKMLFICSPNNPSGNQMAQDEIETILQHFNGLVIVDEAYIDFAPQNSLTTLLSQYPNLVVLQTFSKAWGMAALRIGMAFASKEIIQIINKIKPPYNINQLTQSKALEAMVADDKRKQKVAEIIQLRNELAATLNQLPKIKKVYRSDANFLLVKVDNAKKTYQYLIDQLVIVRDRSSVQLCDNCLRITVGLIIRK
jgi:histidinol-phosphate aminotransferase